VLHTTVGILGLDSLSDTNYNRLSTNTLQDIFFVNLVDSQLVQEIVLRIVPQFVRKIARLVHQLGFYFLVLANFLRKQLFF
jgi:hypothetical protein